jgi:hypothetical protein
MGSQPDPSKRTHRFSTDLCRRKSNNRGRGVCRRREKAKPLVERVGRLPQRTAIWSDFPGIKEESDEMAAHTECLTEIGRPSGIRSAWSFRHLIDCPQRSAPSWKDWGRSWRCVQWRTDEGIYQGTDVRPKGSLAPRAKAEAVSKLLRGSILRCLRIRAATSIRLERRCIGHNGRDIHDGMAPSRPTTCAT